MGKGPNLSDQNFKNNNDFVILTNPLCYNCLGSLKDLDPFTMDLVSGVHKDSGHGGYLPLYMVGSLISVKKFLTLTQDYQVLPSVVDIDRTLL